PHLTIETHTTIEPRNMPETSAIAAIANQMLAREGASLRLAAKPTAKTSAAKATPPAACQRQYGWSETGAPQVNLTVRSYASSKPQWPPTVPSCRRFQG